MTIPKVPKEKRKSKLAGFAVTINQKKELEERAKKEGLTVSEFLRKIIFSENQEKEVTE